MAGLVVMLGWVFDINILKGILPIWPTMKVTTALCFFISGLSLIFIRQMLQRRTDAAQLVLSAASFIILLIMLTFLVSAAAGIHTGLENFYIKNQGDVIMTTSPGRPSVGTMINFILIGMSGILVIFSREISLNVLPKIGWIVTFIGLVAILGYVLNFPLLYYSAEDVSLGMALHTAILFVMLGLGLVFTTRVK